MRMSRQVLASTIFIVTMLMSATAYAQVPAPAPTTGYAVQWRQGSTTVREDNLSVTNFTCDLAVAPVILTVITNPSKLRIQDPQNSARECETDITSLVRSLPVGTNYTGWVAAISNILTPPNDRSTYTMGTPNFNVTPVYGLPVAPKLVKVLQ